jgi:hypothetical protein
MRQIIANLLEGRTINWKLIYLTPLKKTLRLGDYVAKSEGMQEIFFRKLPMGRAVWLRSRSWGPILCSVFRALVRYVADNTIARRADNTIVRRTLVERSTREVLFSIQNSTINAELIFRKSEGSGGCESSGFLRKVAKRFRGSRRAMSYQITRSAKAETDVGHA